MSENISLLPEKVEVIEGDALNARQKAQALFVGLGPPDLCVLTKDYTPGKLMLASKPQRFTYYHWILGMDSSSIYQITNYFDSLVTTQEKKGVARGAYTLASLHYISYNAFRKMDLHVEVCKPDNATTIYAVDGSGGRHEVDDSFWRQTYVCQMLRYINGPTRETRPLRMYHTLTDKAGEESRFLTMCAEFFQEAKTALVPAPTPRHTSDTEEEKAIMDTVDSSNNLLTTTLCYYFIRHHRYEPLISFLTNWRESEPNVAVPISGALVLDGDMEKARALLQAALVADETDPSIMLALVELSLKEIQGMPPTSASRETRLDEALKLALKATEAEPGATRGWWGLARVLVEMGRYEWALAAMNHAPELLDQDRVNKTANMDRIGVPQFSRLTTPTQISHDVMVDMQDEVKEFDSQNGEQALRLLSGASLSGDGKIVYELLSDIVSKVGWENLVRARERVLVRPAELERERSRSEKLSSAEVEQHMEAASKADTITESMSLEDSAISPPPVHNPDAGDDSHNKGIQNSPGLPPHHVRRLSAVDSQGEKKPQLKESKLSTVENAESADESSDSSADATPETSTQVASPLPTRLQLDESSVSPASDTASFEDVSLSPSQQREAALSPAVTRTPPPTPAEASAAEEAGPSSSSSSSASVETPVAVQYNTVATQTEPDAIDLEMGAFLLHHRRQTRTYATPPFTVEVYADSGAILDVPITNISQVLELAFHALFQDIKAFHIWKEEQKSVSAETEQVVVHTAAKLNPERSSADWVRLAMVASRLKFREDAEMLYLLAGAYPIAWLGLLNLYAARGDIRNTIITASTVQKHYQEKHHIAQTHPDVITSVLRVMGYYGLQKVRTVQSGVAECHPVIPNILFDSVRWRSKGFDQ